MRPFPSAFVAGVLWLAPHVAAAAERPGRRIDVAASLGYAAPLGDAERGARTSDTALALVPFGLEMAYRLAPSAGMAMHLRYGVGIPTLCRASSDCESSLASDVVAGFAARVYLPKLGSLAALADVGIGYEWLTTRLSDAGATSTRSYAGPVLLSEVFATPLHLRDRVGIGPFVGVTLGTFRTYGLETNLGPMFGKVSARALHAWMLLGVRLSLSL